VKTEGNESSASGINHGNKLASLHWLYCPEVIGFIQWFLVKCLKWNL